MIHILPEALQTRVEVDGRTYRLKPAAANVLRAIEALEDEWLTRADQIRLAVWHLYRRPRPKPSEAAVNAALDMLTEPSPYRTGKSRQSLDFRQDAALITAAFRQLYGIDLQREISRMDWRVFLALVSGITDDTQVGAIMSLRTRELPRRNQHNGEMIRQLQKQKAMYALKTRRGGQNFEDGLRAMAEILIAMAGGEAKEITHEERDPAGPDRPGVPDGTGRTDGGCV